MASTVADLTASATDGRKFSGTKFCRNREPGWSSCYDENALDRRAESTLGGARRFEIIAVVHLTNHKCAWVVALCVLTWFARGWQGQCAETAALPGSESEVELFDGLTLAGWAQSGFEGEADVRVVRDFADRRAAIVIEKGTTLSGFTWTKGGALPRTNYEISLEAMRIEGSDFFCGLTFPVGKTACTFIVGGWGGNVVGLSNVDRADASQNETFQEMEFADRRWYRIRVRVTDEKIEAWIDDARKVDLRRAGRTFGLRPGDIQKSQPLGIASYMSRAAIRDIRLRRLTQRDTGSAMPKKS